MTNDDSFHVDDSDATPTRGTIQITKNRRLLFLSRSDDPDPIDVPCPCPDVTKEPYVSECGENCLWSITSADDYIGFELCCGCTDFTSFCDEPSLEDLAILRLLDDDVDCTLTYVVCDSWFPGGTGADGGDDDDGEEESDDDRIERILKSVQEIRTKKLTADELQNAREVLKAAIEKSKTAEHGFLSVQKVSNPGCFITIGLNLSLRVQQVQVGGWILHLEKIELPGVRDRGDETASRVMPTPPVMPSDADSFTPVALNASVSLPEDGKLQQYWVVVPETARHPRTPYRYSQFSTSQWSVTLYRLPYDPKSGCGCNKSDDCGCGEKNASDSDDQTPA
ncbi:MAG: hypothetical protein AAFP90_06630 [Planctomycetota bacterium]